MLTLALMLLGCSVDESGRLLSSPFAPPPRRSALLAESPDDRCDAPALGNTTAVMPDSPTPSWAHPLGPPDGEGYYDAQPFGVNAHLGSDWNGNGGKNTDLGDPVHAMGDGLVTASYDAGGGWGNLVRVAHRTQDGTLVESLYAHLQTREVCAGEQVKAQQRIGTIGTAGGHYLAHLHLELRDAVGLPVGAGYGTPDGHLDPTAFLQARGVPVDPTWRAPEPESAPDGN